MLKEVVIMLNYAPVKNKSNYAASIMCQGLISTQETAWEWSGVGTDQIRNQLIRTKVRRPLSLPANGLGNPLSMQNSSALPGKLYATSAEKENTVQVSLPDCQNDA